MIIRFKKLHEKAVVPARKHKEDAGADVTAVSIIDECEDTITYGTGLAFCPPAGVEMQARPRSSIRDTGLVLPNSPGTLDSNFRGEVTATFYKVIKSRKPYKVGDRIFQIVINEAIAKPWDIQFVEAETLSDSSRGTGGYGSTGK